MNRASRHVATTAIADVINGLAPSMAMNIGRATALSPAAPHQKGPLRSEHWLNSLQGNETPPDTLGCQRHDRGIRG